MRPGSRWTHGQRVHGMRDHLPPQTCLLGACEERHMQAASNPAARGWQTPVTLEEQIKVPVPAKSEVTSLVWSHTGTFLWAGANDGFSLESSEQEAAPPGNLQAQPRACLPARSRNERAK